MRFFVMHTFWHSSKALLAGYRDFHGRSSRAEYWWAVVFNIFLHGCLGALFGSLGMLIGNPGSLALLAAYLIIYLYILLCTIALIVRRLHDINRSGWWFLIVLTGIGSLVLLYWYCVEGDKGENRFGVNPYARS